MDNKLKTKLNLLFLMIVVLIICIPAVSLNTRREYRSEIDNSMLIEFPEFDREFPERINRYVEERIGFRVRIITAYQDINNKLFHYLAHPLYEYGREDWIMTRNWDAEQTYHLDVSDDYIHAFAEYVDDIKDVSLQNNARFVFVLIPNKETIYYDKISPGYNINYESITKSDRIINELNRRKINNVYFRDLFLEKKDELLLYNKKNDAGHWNDNGAIIGMTELYDYLTNQMGISVEPIRKDEFELSYTTAEYLLESFIRIDETVPQYILKKENYELSDDSYWEGCDLINSNAYRSHTYNEELYEKGAPSILIFGDSYILLREKYFANNFSEAAIVHRSESPNIVQYINKMHPDIVVLEATERVIGPDKDCGFEFLSSYKFSRD